MQVCRFYLLDSEEQAIWWDRPDPSSYAWQGAERALPVGFFFVCIGFFLFTKAVDERAHFIALFCAFFVLLGLYAMSEPVRRYLQAGRIVYLLTSKRAVIAEGGQSESVSISTIASIDLKRKSGPFGDVLYFDRPIKGSEGETTFVRDGFVGITDADVVAREIQRLQAGA